MNMQGGTGLQAHLDQRPAFKGKAQPAAPSSALRWRQRGGDRGCEAASNGMGLTHENEEKAHC
ncbi:hypothetical protein PPTS312_39200 [Pseudomonas putida]|uniref:Uncharacterized protein n=1 Tax=Pseudomonas putida TaxID=303 RepID=A0A7U6M4U6_PSEPU|nr:hypothetical protein PPTS312_39200 [Pseudomonas putida]